METGIQFAVHFTPLWIVLRAEEDTNWREMLLPLDGRPLHGYYQGNWQSIICESRYKTTMNDNDVGFLFFFSNWPQSSLAPQGTRYLLLLPPLVAMTPVVAAGWWWCGLGWEEEEVLGYLHSGSQNQVLVLAAHYFICHHLLYYFIPLF